MENLELSDVVAKLKQREAELAVINSVQQGLVAEMDMQGIYDLVGDKIRELFDAQVTMIAVFDHDNHLEDFKYFFEAGERFFPNARRYNNLREQLIEQKKLLLINENVESYISDAVPGTAFPKSMVFVPLVTKETVFGYVSLQNIDHEFAFNDSDVRLLGTLANSMSVALENARLFNETEQREAELTVINSVQKGLMAAMDMQGVYDLIGDHIRETFGVHAVVIRSFDTDAGLERWHYAIEKGVKQSVPPRPLDDFARYLISLRTPLVINDHFSDFIRDFSDETSVEGETPKSAVFVPLIAGDKLLGNISLQDVDNEGVFSEDDVRLLTTLANSMSVALENARLFNETEQRNAELAVINSVQQGLVAEMDMQGIYDLVGDRIRDLFDSQVTMIVTFNQDTSTEHFQYLFEDGERLFPDSRPLDKIRKWIIKNATLLLVNEDAEDTIHRITGEPKGTTIPGTLPPKSLLFVPLIVGEDVRGCVSLQNLDHEHAFSDADVRLLSTLANSMSVALENARLFNETEQRNAELAVINSVQDGLVREMDMAAIYKLVGERICAVLNTQTLVIRTFDHEKKVENWQYAVEMGERIEVEPQPFIFASEILINTKKHLLISKDFEKFAVEHGDTPTTKGLAPKSAIFVPMMVGGTVVGSVSLQNVEIENAFTESDLQLITTLTNSMSVAIENARLFNETTRLLQEMEQRAAELQTVNNISRALVSQLELDKLIELVGEQMRETFKADIVYLALHNLKTNMLNFPYYYGDEPHTRPFGNGITEKIILKKEPLLINQNIDDAYHRLEAEKKGEMVESYLGVPIMAGSESIGVISVQSREQENRFNENDMRLLTTIAANVGVAMQNAEAYLNLQEALTDLKSAQEQLVQQEKLASLGQLTAGIAHEIKNPLNFVNNFSDVSMEMIDEALEELQKIGQNDNATEVATILADIKSNLAKIHEHGTRADGIVKSMLMHSRGGDGKLELTPLNPVIKEYVNLAFHGMRAGKNAIDVSIDLQLDEAVGQVPLVTEDFSRVILNLCTNAFDAMRDKLTTTRDKANAISFSPKLTVRTKLEKGGILIEIEDNGPGIPEDIKDKILQPFYTTKKGTQGTGLGLSITNDIIKSHGGTLEIESSPGRTVFTIKL